MAGVVVYGVSDDLIEVEGDSLREEFSYSGDEDGDLLAFSTGTVLRIRYDDDGVWRITPLILGGGLPITIELAPIDDDDDYSDRATVEGDVRWVVQGSSMAKAHP